MEKNKLTECQQRWVTKAVMAAAHIYNIKPEDVIKKTKGEVLSSDIKKAKKLAMSILENKRMDLKLAAKCLGYPKMAIGVVTNRLKSHPIPLKELVAAAEFYNRIEL